MLEAIKLFIFYLVNGYNVSLSPKNQTSRRPRSDLTTSIVLPDIEPNTPRPQSDFPDTTFSQPFTSPIPEISIIKSREVTLVEREVILEEVFKSVFVNHGFIIILCIPTSMLMMHAMSLKTFY